VPALSEVTGWATSVMVVEKRRKRKDGLGGLLVHLFPVTNCKMPFNGIFRHLSAVGLFRTLRVLGF
jgi:hypothetical protein